MESLYNNSPYGFYPPNRFRSPFYRNNNYTYRKQNSYSQENNTKNSSERYEHSNSNDEPKVRSVNNTYSPVFEIFGIKLFFDDILLISLIFFLYNEGVQDQNLFIALILLLLS